MATREAHIVTKDFDRFVSEVSTQIWNQIVHQQPFHALRPGHFADLFEAVSRTLSEYRTDNKIRGVKSR